MVDNTRGRRKAAPGPMLVGRAVEDFLRTSGLANSLVNRALHETWRDTVGGEVSEHTRVAGIRKKVLIIEVDSAPWLNELAGFHKDSILKEVQRKLPDEGIVDIQFKAGSF